MQFNYENVKVKVEENSTDYRTFGLLNNNLVNDEQEYINNTIKMLEKKLYISEKNNLTLMELNKKYIEDINNLLESHKLLIKEFSKKLEEIQNKKK